MTIFTSWNYMDAEMVACALRGYEVDAIVLDENTCRIYPQIGSISGGVKLLISTSDSECAVDILQRVFNGEAPFGNNGLSVPLCLPAAIAMKIRRWVADRHSREPS